MDQLGHCPRRRFAPQIRQSQLQVLGSRQRWIVVSNAVVAATTAFVALHIHGHSGAVLAWLVIVLLSLLLRIFAPVVLAPVARLRGDPAIGAGDSRSGLRIMAAGALGSGLAWAALPFVISDFNGLGVDAFVYLVLSGISAGAVVLALGSAAVSLSFALPPQIAVLASLLMVGNVVALVLAANVLMFMIVLVRSARAAERMFVVNELARLRATSLAESLRKANDDILVSNIRLDAAANSDPVTGLANRSRFVEWLAEAVAGAGNQEVCLLVVDIDGFKTINDTLGQGAGDVVLREVGTHLAAWAAGNGTLARLGGDEFALMLRGPRAAEAGRLLAAAIVEPNGIPVTLAGSTTIVGVSLGLASYPAHASTAEDLFACADMAIQAAKAGGRRRLQEYEPDMRSRVDRRRIVEQDLALAIAEEALEVWFQPQVRLDTGETAGFEALLRWTHPQLGPISPPEIVTAARLLHLSEPLTAFVTTRTCELLSGLPALGLPKASVAVNVSPYEFSLYDVAGMLDRITSAHGVSPALFEIEITEEAMLDTRRAGEQLKRIETAGYKIAVDDFGMGHSSLAYLVSLHVDRLKIDRSFVTGLAASRANRELISALIKLGQALSIEIVVEGTETEADATTLAILGCRVAQGYHFGRPMPRPALIDWIAEHAPSADVIDLHRAVA